MSSSDGQADYYATSKCLRKYFKHDNNKKIIQTLAVPEIARRKCEQSFHDAEKAAICMRTAVASESATKIFSLSRGVAFATLYTEDRTVVSQTNSDRHPAPQCRLDTFFAGAVCKRSHLLPFSNYDARSGACNRSYGDTEGVRPLCWYYPSS